VANEREARTVVEERVLGVDDRDVEARSRGDVDALERGELQERSDQSRAAR
jgi:hypothetical protein